MERRPGARRSRLRNLVDQLVRRPHARRVRLEMLSTLLLLLLLFVLVAVTLPGAHSRGHIRVICVGCLCPCRHPSSLGCKHHRGACEQRLGRGLPRPRHERDAEHHFEEEDDRKNNAHFGGMRMRVARRFCGQQRLPHRAPRPTGGRILTLELGILEYYCTALPYEP